MNLKRVISIVFAIILTVSFFGFQTAGIVAGAEIDVSSITDHESQLFDPSVFENLDYGIYWCGPEYQMEKASADKNDYSYYDPNKPTMIFVHGYQLNSGYYQRETLQIYSEFSTPGISGLDRYTARKWIDKGYNVGQFHWNQLCDVKSGINDSLFPNPVKIWSIDEGVDWRKPDGKNTAADDPSNPKVSVAELFAEEYKTAMKGYCGPEVRIVGHSMGAEVVTAGGYILNEMRKDKKITNAMMPKRISLIDPYTAYALSFKDFTISWNGENTNGRTIFEIMTEYLEKLSADGIAIDGYAGMELAYRIFMNNTNKNKMIETYRRFLDTVAFVYLDGLLEATNSTSIHSAARDWYMLSVEQDIKDLTFEGADNYGICASTPTDYVYAMKGKAYSQRDTGTNTFLVDNDYETQIVISNISEMADSRASVPADIPSGSISGKVKINKTLKDTYNSLYGCGGMTVNLTDANGNIIKTVETAENGWYRFDNLPKGTYKVQFDKSPAFSFYKNDAGLDRNYYYSDVADFDEGLTNTITLASDHSNIIANCIINYAASFVFGLIIAVLVIATISFTVYLQVKKNRHKKALTTD